MPEEDDAPGSERLPRGRRPLKEYDMLVGRDALRDEIKNYIAAARLISQADLDKAIDRIIVQLEAEVARRWSKAGISVDVNIDKDTSDEELHRAFMAWWRSAYKDPDWWDGAWANYKELYKIKLASKGRWGRAIGPLSGFVGAATALAAFLYDWLGRK